MGLTEILHERTLMPGAKLQLISVSFNDIKNDNTPTQTSTTTTNSLHLFPTLSQHIPSDLFFGYPPTTSYLFCMSYVILMSLLMLMTSMKSGD